MSELSETGNHLTDELARGSGTALWRQIAEKIERDILSAGLQPGEKMPTEHDLAERFGVNRHTVRRAVAVLTEKGLVRVEQGRGSFVQETVIDYRVRKRTRFSENIAALRRESAGTVLKLAEMPADATIAQALEIAPGATVVMMERLSEADGRPLNVATHYYPKALVPGIADAFRQSASVTDALTSSGVTDYSRKITRVTARVARAADSRLLAQPPNRPILMTESINIDAAGRPIEYAIARWASDRVQLVFEPGH